MSNIEIITSDIDKDRLEGINSVIQNGLADMAEELLSNELLKNDGEVLSSIISFSVQILAKYEKEGTLELLAALCQVINEDGLQ